MGKGIKTSLHVVICGVEKDTEIKSFVSFFFFFFFLKGMNLSRSKNDRYKIIVVYCYRRSILNFSLLFKIFPDRSIFPIFPCL